jgi:glycosyltransferase involved in cell wall biosynthesis
VVASQVAGVPDVIDDGVHGLIVPERDPAALAAAIVRLIVDRPFAEGLGRAARARIEQDLTWEKAAERFERVYVQAAGDRGPGTGGRGPGAGDRG